ncbi:MAG: dihydroneopterin aldolase [Calditrichota bacterium]
MEIIRLNNMIFYAHHGYYQAERELGQKFEVDVIMNCDLSRAMVSDNLDDTVNYKNVYKHICDVFNNNKFILIESLAGHIADDLLKNFPIESLTIRIRKPQVSLNGFLDSVEVEISRKRS